MTDPKETPSNDPSPETPLDQTTAPLDQIQEGDITGDVPLDQTRSEMRPFLGSRDIPESKHRRRK
jgi:hypothetical protein